MNSNVLETCSVVRGMKKANKYTAQTGGAKYDVMF
jgi:hypothetical protein